MSTNIEPAGSHRRSNAAVAVALMLLAVASSAGAHNLRKRQVEREIVRLQGYRSELPAGVQAQREMVLSILGEEQKFYLIDWRRFRLTDEKAPGEERDSGRFALQGERAALVKIANARPAQRVTILGERRASSSDIFVLALDLCPPE